MLMKLADEFNVSIIDHESLCYMHANLRFDRELFTGTDPEIN